MFTYIVNIYYAGAYFKVTFLCQQPLLIVFCCEVAIKVIYCYRYSGCTLFFVCAVCIIGHLAVDTAH
jgi:hypothetical protein